MTDHEQRTLVLAKESKQPRLRVDVEVVGRLVETQHVGTGEQDAGQLDPAPLTTRQRADRLVEPGIGDSETRSHRTGFTLSGVPARGTEGLLGVDVAADVSLVGVLLHGDAELLDANDLVVDPSPRQHVGHAGTTVEGRVDLGVLREIAEPALAEHVAGLWFVGAAEHLEQAGLAGAVASDDAHLVPGHHGEAGSVDEESTTHFHRDRLSLEHQTRLREHLRSSAGRARRPIATAGWSGLRFGRSGRRRRCGERRRCRR